MAQVKIKRIKRNKKALSPKEKLLAGLGVGGAMMGIMAPVAGQQSQTQRVSVQDQGFGRNLEQKLTNWFGIPTASADVENPEAALALSASTLSLSSGQTATVTVTVNGIAAASGDLSASSSNSAVTTATVDGSGQIIITAKSNATASNQTATVTVHPVALGSDTSQDQTVAVTVIPDSGSVENSEFTLIISSASLSLSSNQTATVTSTLNGIATASGDLSASSSNSAVATAAVSSSGQIIITAGNNTTTSNQTATVTVHPTAAGTDTSADKTISVTVAGSGSTALPSFTSSSLAAGYTSSSYSAQVQATGSSALTFSLAGGSLPPGLSMNSAGMITGTPTSQGVYSFSVQVADQQGHTASRQFSIAIYTTGGGGGGSYGSNGVYFVNSYMPAASVNQNYSAQVPGYSNLPLTYQLASGSLPPGLNLNSAGLLSGLPTVAGSYNFSIRAVTQQGDNATGQFSMTVSSPAAGSQAGSGFQGLQIPSGYPASLGGTAWQGTQNQGYQGSASQSGGGLQMPGGSSVAGSSTTTSGATYVVKKGDTLWAISKKYYSDGRKWRAILSANPRCLSIPSNTKTLRIGAVLNIP